MIDLADFLLARFAEDEEAARAAVPGPTWIADGGEVYAEHPTNSVVDYTNAAEHIARWDPARVLAECDAKRRIVEEEHHNVNDGDCGTCVRGQWGYPTHGGALPESWPCSTLRLLALPYAEHPDYDEAWRP